MVLRTDPCPTPWSNWVQELKVVWILTFSYIWFFDLVWKYSEYNLRSDYARVLNMLGLKLVVNKILHHRYLIGFWICLEFWIRQFYLGFCKKQLITHVWQGSEYSSGADYARALNIQGFWIYQGFTRFHVNCVV